MTLTIVLTEEEIQRVEEARKHGVDIDALVRNLLISLPQESPAKQKPRTGAELLAVLRTEGLIGHPYGDMNMNSQEYALHLRKTLWKSGEDVT